MIIVTGASRGLGFDICQRLISQGYEVLGLARNTDSLDFNAMTCDVSDYDQVRLVATNLKRSGICVKGLINAAGIASMNLAVTTPAKVTQNIINTNLMGTIYCCQQLAPLMMRNKKGTIINFSTIAVALGLKGESIYAASKAGVEAFSRVFAREVADFGINVNCIAPGPIATDLLKGVSSAQIESIVDQQVIRTNYSASTISDLVEVLLDERSRSLSGQVLHVGGV